MFKKKRKKKNKPDILSIIKSTAI